MFQEKFFPYSSENLILFLGYLNDRVIGMYQNKIARAQAQTQLNSYHPAKYYIYCLLFQSWGLRGNHLFTVDEKGSSQNFATDQLKYVTNLSQVRKRGSSYLFCDSVFCLTTVMVFI